MKEQRQNLSSEELSRATEWFVKRHSSVLSAIDEQRFQDWLSEDVENADRLEEVEHRWAEMQELSSWADEELSVLAARRDRSRRLQPRYALALLASLFLAILLSAYWPVRQDRPILVETAQTEQRQLTLDDGSRVHLNSESIVEVSYSAASRQVVLESGETVFDVAHDSERPFIVNVDGFSVIAVGTRFSVRHEMGGGAQVTVIEGKVAVVRASADSNSSETVNRVSHLQSDGVFVGENEQVTIGRKGELSAVTQVDAREATSWLEGKLIFRETPLSKVVSEMSRYVPGEIMVVPELADTPVSGIFYIRSKESMIELLASAVPVIPVKQSSSTIVLHSVTDAPTPE